MTLTNTIRNLLQLTSIVNILLICLVTWCMTGPVDGIQLLSILIRKIGKKNSNSDQVDCKNIPFSRGPLKEISLNVLRDDLKDYTNANFEIHQICSSPVGIISFIKSEVASTRKNGVSRQQEAIDTFTRVQELGLGSYAKPWTVPVTLFTTHGTIVRLLQYMAKAKMEKIAWPFQNVVLWDKFRDLIVTKKSMGLTCCEKCCGSVEKWSLKIAGMLYSPYQKSLFMDTDVWLCESESIQDYFQLLDQYDLLITDDKQNGGARLAKTYVPRNFTERNTGVVFYNLNSPVVPQMLEKYASNFVHLMTTQPSLKHDQPAFRWALHEFANQVKTYELPRTVHCRGSWPFKAMKRLESLQCLFVHGDNRTRTRHFKLPCKNEDLQPYRQMVKVEKKKEDKTNSGLMDKPRQIATKRWKAMQGK